jgi:hypothetical protein
MRIDQLIWLDAIIEKLVIKHHVDVDEVEEVLINQPKFRFVERGDREDEDVYMAENNREGLPQFPSVAALTDFFDIHDMGDYTDDLPEAQFEVNINKRQYLVAVDANIMQQVIAIAKTQHVSAETLINKWLEEQTSKAA